MPGEFSRFGQDNATTDSQMLPSFPPRLKYLCRYSSVCWTASNLSAERQFHHNMHYECRCRWRCMEDSYSCAQTFWKSLRSNIVLTLQSVSPLWILQPCRVRALWSIQSRILLERENSVLANRCFTKLHHGSDYTQWERCWRFFCCFNVFFFTAFILKAFNTACAFSHYISESGCWIVYA